MKALSHFYDNIGKSKDLGKQHIPSISQGLNMSSNKQMTLSDIEAMVARLSKIKEPQDRKIEPQKRPSLTKEEAEQLFERLANNKKIPSPQAPRKNNGSELTREEIDKLFERLSKTKTTAPQPPVNRGDVATQMQIDKLVERLSVVKKPLEQANGETTTNGLKLTKSAMQELVLRLSDKEVAAKHTPDTKRIMKSRYGIVSSYAWNGYNYQAILCNEESP